MHETFVDFIFNFKSAFSIEGYTEFTENAGIVAQVQDQEIGASGIEWKERFVIQGCFEVMEKDRVLSDGVNADFSEGELLKSDAIAASEDIGIFDAFKEAVNKQSAVRSGRQT